MSQRTYTFELECPRCGRDSITETTDRSPPVMKCGECLFNDVEVVDLTIVRVTVHAATQEATK